MGKRKVPGPQTVGKLMKNHATGREEVRKDALYSFVVPQFQGWEPRKEKKDGPERRGG